MLAFNLIRIPDPPAYKAYSSHFAELPERYGMRFVAAGSLSTSASECVLRGDSSLPANQALCANDLFALVHFPSPIAFLQAWSDPQLAEDAYPLRAPMIENGSRHIWIRTAAAD